MKEKKSVVRIICLILVILMAVTTIVPVFYSAFAETPAEKLSRLRKELQAQKEENESLQNSIDKNQQTKTYYQQLLTSVTAQIETQKELIATQEEYIAAKQDEIAQKVLDVAYAKDMFENRLKGMYEMSRQSNLSVLLGISDFSEMLRFAENLNCISKSDTELIESTGRRAAGRAGRTASTKRRVGYAVGHILRHGAVFAGQH
jgi:peptidoglycan hydrolase CwlO-like protein